jgi:hypothetical protein
MEYPQEGLARLPFANLATRETKVGRGEETGQKCGKTIRSNFLSSMVRVSVRVRVGFKLRVRDVVTLGVRVQIMFGSG